MRMRIALVLISSLGLTWTGIPTPSALPSNGWWTMRQAHAATDAEKAGARALAVQAIEVYGQGQYEQTLDLLRRAESLVHSPTHWLYMARAHAKLGRLVLAQEAYLKAAREPLDNSPSEAFRNAVGTANAELEALQPRIAKVTVNVVGVERSTATVTVDGAAVPSALVGVPMPTDPGERTFEASAPGMVSASERLVIKEGDRASIELALQPAPSVTPTPETHATETSSTVDSGVPPSTRESSNILLYTGIGAATLGAGGIIVGYLKYAQGNDPRDRADASFEACNASAAGCSNDDRSVINALDDEAYNHHLSGGIIMGIGGAVLATGATLLVLHFTSEGDGGTETGITVSPWVTASGLGLNGTF